jgi:hypothetical protein
MADHVMTKAEASVAFNNSGFASNTNPPGQTWDAGNGVVIDDPFSNRGRVLQSKYFVDNYALGESDNAEAKRPSGTDCPIWWTGGDKEEVFFSFDVALDNNFIMPMGIHLPGLRAQNDQLLNYFQLQLNGPGDHTNHDGILCMYLADSGGQRKLRYFNAADPTQPITDGFGPVNQYTKMPRGRWVTIELQVKMNTPGQADGICRVWMDSVLVIDQPRNWNGTTGLLWQRCINQTWYGGNEQKWAAPQNQSIYFDNFIVAESRITG